MSVIQLFLGYRIRLDFGDGDRSILARETGVEALSD